MRTSISTSLVLALSAALLVVLGSVGLGLGPSVLVGAGLGAVVWLVPDRSPLARVGGLVAGVLVAWLGYVLRAAVLPDTPGGHAVSVALTVVLAGAVVVASRERLPLWAPLLGAAALAGVYETAYSEAPPEVLATSFVAVTTLACTLAVGLVLTSLVAPGGQSAAPQHRHARHEGDPDGQVAETVPAAETAPVAQTAPSAEVAR
ncbi:hypothetical protein [Nocardioides bruguierae]|uniref:Uncharacterized protein n=1 Tax=Nocardioides bruguierae TaxID=2945102 RepID=A0A9X2DA46_9ACTN|nr:hypothetical protein [Nocardioides bruguierae]MCM0622136.1 hypothetical protein [Nocardioides bruguierae]